MKVRIGITSGWEPGTIVEGWPLIYVNRGTVKSLEKAGAIPVVFPVVETEELFKDYLNIVDGLIVSGEVLSIKRNVVKDGGENILENSNPLRYKNERVLIREAIKRNIPILGICRGHQVLAVEEGGRMKDRDITVGNDILHQQGGISTPDQAVHKISIKRGTKLYKLLNKEDIMVNSFHRQAIDKLPEGYIASAVTADGTVEAIETKDDRFIVGVQFHPEMLNGEIWDDFFKGFVNIVSQQKRC